MAMVRILDCKVGETEFLAHFIELLRRRVLESHPDKRIRPLDVFADRLLGDVAEFLAFLIRDAVDEHDAFLPRSGDDSLTRPVLASMVRLIVWLACAHTGNMRCLLPA